MAFVWSNIGGCNADVNDATYNPTALTTSDDARAAHVNELRRALEDWRSNHLVSAFTWTGTGDSVDPVFDMFDAEPRLS